MVARAKGRPSWVPQSIDAAALGEQGSSSDFDKTSHGPWLHHVHAENSEIDSG